ncbi:hypothetical protein DL769_004669 [Monosporascus sp. CRB-8-3]|nr:hypothetical protein DL769_004669 [Monosporascus sp. CRB-8-3]
MGQKREGPPLVKQESESKRIKSEKFEDTKFDLRSIPQAPTTAFKVKEEADSKPKLNMTGPTGNGSAQSSGSSKRLPKSRRRYNSPQVVKVYLGSSRNRGISGHYDRGREKVFLRSHGDFDWNSDLSSVGQIFDRLSSAKLHVIPASTPVFVRPSHAPAVTAMLAPAPGQLNPPSPLLQAGPGDIELEYKGADTLPPGVIIKVDERGK